MSTQFIKRDLLFRDVISDHSPSTITAWDVWLPISAEIVRIDFGDKGMVLWAVNDGDEEETSVRRVVITAGEASIPVSRDEFTYINYVHGHLNDFHAIVLNDGVSIDG